MLRSKVVLNRSCNFQLSSKTASNSIETLRRRSNGTKSMIVPPFDCSSAIRMALSPGFSFGGSAHHFHSCARRSKRLSFYERTARFDVGARSLEGGWNAQRAVCGSEGGERPIAAGPIRLDPVFYGEICQF